MVRIAAVLLSLTLSTAAFGARAPFTVEDRDIAFGQVIEREIGAGETATYTVLVPDDASLDVTAVTHGGSVTLTARDAQTDAILCRNETADGVKQCRVDATAGTNLVIDVRGDTFATYTLRVSTSATISVAPWPVPYLRQTDYPNIGQSACGPTSVAMLLRYYFPNSAITPPDVYHSGTQQYRYESGPALGYRNVGFVTQYGDTGLSIVPSQYRSYYANLDSGAVISSVTAYLNRTWAVQLSSIGLSSSAVLNALQSGPLLARVNGNGNTAYPHILVITGVASDGSIVVNDPYWWGSGTINGNGRRVASSTFFGTWLKEAFTFRPSDGASARVNSVVVDVAHNSIEGNVAVQRLNLEQPNDLWYEYYGNGNNYLSPNTAGKAARWTPHLPRSGNYFIIINYYATSRSGAVNYDVRDSTDRSIGGFCAWQYSTTSAWRSVTLGPYPMTVGASLKAWGISANTTIGSVRFVYAP